MKDLLYRIFAALTAVHKRFTRLMGGLIHLIFAAIGYFLVFTPVALFRRHRGRQDAAHPILAPQDPGAKTYWITRTAPPTDMRRQY